MTRQIISTGTTANDGTGDTLRDGAAKINANFQEIYETFGPDGLIIGTRVDFDSATINFLDNTLTFKTNVGAVGPTADRTIRFPDYSAFVVLDSATQTLRNKTLDSCSYGRLLINDLSATHQYQVYPAELTGNITTRLPVLTDSDDFVFARATQTIKNKSLDSDTINNAIIPDGTWQDTNNNEIIGFTKQPSAVNYLEIGNASASNPVDIQGAGDDTDVDLRLLPKGAGSVELSTRVVFGDGQRADITASSGTLDNDEPALFLDYGTGVGTYTVQDGDQKGQVMYLTNKNASQNASITPTNFAQGSSFTLESLEVAHMIWDGTNWFVINKSDVTITP